MTTSIDNVTTHVRVAHFGNLELPVRNTLNLSVDNIDSVLAKIRQYADLPYVYLVSKGQTVLVRQLLDRLAAIKSPCYPHALILTADAEMDFSDSKVDIIKTSSTDPVEWAAKIKAYASCKFVFDYDRLKFENRGAFPAKVDVMIIGAGVVGLYAANYLKKHNISFCIADKRDMVGGIWSLYANCTSQVNTSEGAYRLIDNKLRSNRDHSPTHEILEDIVELTEKVADRLFLDTHVDWIDRTGSTYQTRVTRDGQTITVQSKGVILAINDRVGSPRIIEWRNQAAYKGAIMSGISNEASGYDWKDKKVVVVGMGAFAIENARTALMGGARHVTVICRRHGTVCPKIIDYLNFSMPYDDDFKHPKKGNMRNMMFWKKLYDISGATMPECWMGKIKHEGHTISVSDIWFIGHYLKKIQTVRGSISGLYETGAIVDDGQKIEADVIVNCVGFYRNAVNVKQICDYQQMYNNNYVDKDFMYLADAYLDDDVFNSFFGSSVLEMAKFYLAVYVHFFDNPDFEAMLQTEGVEAIPLEDRRWSHYIDGALALIRKYPVLSEAARNQVANRTRDFEEVHDLPTYIAENRREWIDTHSLLAGKSMREEDCLPYLFERLLSDPQV